LRNNYLSFLFGLSFACVKAEAATLFSSFVEFLSLKIFDALDAISLEVFSFFAYDKQGAYYFASSSGYAPDILWLLEQCKKHLFDNCN
jgi:hypothetical protein